MYATNFDQFWLKKETTDSVVCSLQVELGLELEQWVHVGVLGGDLKFVLVVRGGVWKF